MSSLLRFAGSVAVLASAAWLYAGGDKCESTVGTCTGDKTSLVSEKSGSCSAEKTSLVSTGGDKSTAACSVEKTSLVTTGDANSSCCASESKAAALVGIPAEKPLDALKPLAGKWQMTTKDADQKEAGVIEFKVSSNGSAIVETMFPGTQHEMTNVYVMDGDRLLMTHYCAVGNAPRMQLASNENSVMKFEFVDATNLPDKTKPYMGRLELTIAGPDNIVQDWTSYNNGKEESHARFELQRVK